MRYIWLLLFLTALGGIFVYQRVLTLQNQHQSRVLRQELQKRQARSESAVRAEQDALSRLELQLKDEKEARDAAAQRLRMEEGLRRADGSLAPLRQDVEKQRKLVQELKEDLRRLKAQRKGTPKQRAQASAQTRLDQQTLDGQIRAQNDVVGGLREQWRTLNAEHNVQARVVRPQLEAAIETLQQLKAQRQGMQDQLKAEQGQAQAQLQQDRARLAEEQRNLESRVQEEKDRLAKLNDSLTDEKKTQSAESDAVKTYRTEKTEHEAAIVRLQQEIAEHRRSLAELQK